MRVTANNDGFRPAVDQSWNVLAEDWLAENGATENVTDRAVGRTPHLLQAELLDTGLVRGDCRAFDGYVVLLGGFGGVDGDLQ